MGEAHVSARPRAVPGLLPVAHVRRRGPARERIQKRRSVSQRGRTEASPVGMRVVRHTRRLNGRRQVGIGAITRPPANRRSSGQSGDASCGNWSQSAAISSREPIASLEEAFASGSWAWGECCGKSSSRHSRFTRKVAVDGTHASIRLGVTKMDTNANGVLRTRRCECNRTGDAACPRNS